MSSMKQNPWLAAAGFGGIGGGLANMFGDYKNPYEAASPYYKQIQEMLPQYFQPYMQAGQQALPGLQQAYGSMLDPNALMQKIGSGYQQSPGFQFQRDQALRSMNNAQAAGGMLGSPQHEQEAGQLATNLANQDYYNYMRQALGLYGQGAQGMQGLASMGAGASMGLGEDIASILGAQGQNAAAEAQAQNQHDQGGMGALFSGISSLLPFFLG